MTREIREAGLNPCGSPLTANLLVSGTAAPSPIARLADADPAAWGRAQDVNLKGVFHGMKAVLPAMRAQGGGTIITVSSGAAVRALEGWSAYCASKAGALMLTQAAHLEEGPDRKSVV